MWKYYALLSALFAALTAVFAKIGVKDINSDLATAIRTLVILFITWGIVFAGNHTAEVKGISGHTWIFLILSGVATGLSWLFYFKALQTGDVSRVAPIDKLSVVPAVERTGQCEGRCRSVADNGRKYGNASKISEYENIDYRRRTQPFG